MNRELSKSSRRVRTVAFFVAAGLLLSGCVRVTYNATLNANGTLSGTFEELLPGSVISIFDEWGVLPRTAAVDDFTYDSWVTDGVTNTCTLTNPEVRINNSRFDAYQPDATILLYGLTMANASSAVYGTDVSAVIKNAEDTFLLLDDIVIQGGCADPGAWVSGGKLASGTNIGNIFGDPATNDDALTMLSNIPSVDKGYMYVLFLTEIESVPYVDFLLEDPLAGDIVNGIFEDSLDHRLDPGELPARLSEIQGLKPIRRDGAKGLSFTFADMPLASANSLAPNFIGEGPYFEKVGNTWKMSLAYPMFSSMDDFAGAFGSPSPSPVSSARLGERTMDAYADLAMDHSFTINGVVTETNGDFNPADNTVDFGMYVNAEYQSISNVSQPSLSAVLGTTVKFTYKKKSLSKEGKAEVKSVKSALLRAHKITIVGILDGTKTSAGDKRKVKLLAQARVKALGKYLAKLGITAKIKYSYSTLSKNNVEAVIKAGQRRAVIQITQ